MSRKTLKIPEIIAHKKLVLKLVKKIKRWKSAMDDLTLIQIEKALKENKLNEVQSVFIHWKESLNNKNIKDLIENIDIDTNVPKSIITEESKIDFCQVQSIQE